MVLEAGNRYCAEMSYEHGSQTAAQQLTFLYIDENLRGTQNWRTLVADHAIVKQYIQRFMEGAGQGWERPRMVGEGGKKSGYGQDIRNTIGQEVCRLVRVFADGRAHLQDAARDQRITNVETAHAAFVLRPPGIALPAAAAPAEHPAPPGGSVSRGATVGPVTMTVGGFTIKPAQPVDGAENRPTGGVKRKKKAKDELTCFCNHCDKIGHKPGSSICAMRNASPEQRAQAVKAEIDARKVATKLRSKARKKQAKLQRDALETDGTQGMFVSTVGAENRGPAALNDNGPAPVLNTGAIEDDGEGATDSGVGLDGMPFAARLGEPSGESDASLLLLLGAMKPDDTSEQSGVPTASADNTGLSGGRRTGQCVPESSERELSTSSGGSELVRLITHTSEPAVLPRGEFTTPGKNHLGGITTLTPVEAVSMCVVGKTDQWK